MTRLWPKGIPIQVQFDPDPSRFTWQGQVHQVIDINKRWRVHTNWWLGRVWRDYYKLTTHSGLLVIIYHDLQTDGWYLQRLHD